MTQCGSFYTNIAWLIITATLCPCEIVSLILKEVKERRIVQRIGTLSWKLDSNQLNNLNESGKK